MLIVQANSGQCRAEAIPTIVEGAAEDCRIEIVRRRPSMHRTNSFEVRLNWLASANAPGAHSEVTSCFAHSAARSLIRSNLSVAGLPFRTIVALLRSSRGKTIALATAEPNFIAP